MRIGLIAQLHGRPGGALHPTWSSIRDLAITAERAGFDIFVFEDALMYRGEDHTDGCWESVAIAGAIAAATSKIRFGQSVMNSPYRSPTLTASMASTLDEISDGRYVLGIGAGNTTDYAEFGFPSDPRFSRFAEAIAIIHALLKEGRVSFDGRFHDAADAELVLRGPSPQGPPINIAAGGPKMMDLVARYGDAWNWWTWDESFEEIETRLRPIRQRLDEACDRLGRDSSEIERTLDVYSIVPPGFDYHGAMEQPIGGSPPEIADFIRSLGSLGFSEVRVDLTDKSPAAIEAMSEIVEMVHSSG